jgi:hypothetical protein
MPTKWSSNSPLISIEDTNKYKFGALVERYWQWKVIDSGKVLTVERYWQWIGIDSGKVLPVERYWQRKGIDSGKVLTVEKPNYYEENPLSCHFLHHKSHRLYTSIASVHPSNLHKKSICGLVRNTVSLQGDGDLLLMFVQATNTPSTIDFILKLLSVNDIGASCRPTFGSRIRVHNNIRGKSVSSWAYSDMWTESSYSGSLTGTDIFLSLFTLNKMYRVSWIIPVYSGIYFAVLPTLYALYKYEHAVLGRTVLEIYTPCRT